MSLQSEARAIVRGIFAEFTSEMVWVYRAKLVLQSRGIFAEFTSEKRGQ